MKSLLKKGMRLTSLALVLGSLVACSGGGSKGKSNTAPNNNNNPPQGGSQAQSGQFVDALVVGLRYKSAALVGVTNDQGQFSCMSGEKISFYLDQDGSKNILLGEVQCRSVISPIELVTNGQKNIKTSFADLTGAERQKVINMLRLIQSLDVDLNVENSIYLESTVMADVASYFEANSASAEEMSAYAQNMIALSAEDFSYELVNLLEAIGRSEEDAVSEADAIAHFEAYRQNCTESSCTAPAMEAPENRHVCIAGYTLMSESNVYVSVVDTMTGQLRAAFQGEGAVEAASSLFVLYEDKSAKLYRRTNAGALFGSETIFSFGADYALFSGAWTFDAEDETVTVDDVQFQESQEDFVFEGVANLGVTGLVMSEQSSDSETQANSSVQQALTYWVVEHDCKLPASDDPNNKGDGSSSIE